jgi:hypothetical protein
LPPINPVLACNYRLIFAQTGWVFQSLLKYQEHQDCSAQGNCLFLWRNAEGSTLRVVTFGYEHALLNWSLE